MQTQLDIILAAKNGTGAAFAAVNQALSRMGLNLGVLQGRLIAALGPAAVGEIVRRSTEEIERLTRAAAAAGSVVSEMSALAFSGRKSDLTGEEMSSGLKKFSQAVAEARKGTGEFAETFAQMNVNLESDSTITILRDTANAFARYRDGADKTALALRLFGRSGDQWLSWLSRGGEALAKDTEQAKAFGLVVDTQLSKSAEDFQSAWKQAGEVARGFGYALTREVAPAITTTLRMVTGENSPTATVTAVTGAVTKTLGAIAKLGAGFVTSLQTGMDLLVIEADGVSKIILATLSADTAAVGRAVGEMQQRIIDVSTRGRAALDSLRGINPEAEPTSPKSAAPTTQFTTEAAKSMREYTASVQAAKMAETLWHNSKLLLRADLTNLEKDQRERLAAGSMVSVIRKEREELLLEIQVLEDRARVLQENIDLLPADSLEQQVKMNAQLRDLQTEKNGAIAKELQLRSDQEKYQARQDEPDISTFHGSMVIQLQTLKNQWVSASHQMATVLTSTVTSAVQGLSNALANVIVGTQSLAQAFSQFALNMATQFIASVLQMVLIATVAIPILTALGILSGGSTAATGLSVTTAALGAGASLSASAVARAAGGIIPGPSSDRDNQLAMVASGEYVARAAAVRYYGAGIFEALNSMRIPRDIMDSWRMPVRSVPRIAFAEGGLVSGMAQAVNVAPAAVHVAILNSRSELQEFLESRAGRRIIVDAAKGSKAELGIRS